MPLPDKPDLQVNREHGHHYGRMSRLNDDYMTDPAAWRSIQHLIPRDKVVWDPFYGDGTSGKTFREMGFTVYHEDRNFWRYTVKNSVVVTNPPFSKIGSILARFRKEEQPFIMLMPDSRLHTKYFQAIFADDPDLIVVCPKKRIGFTQMLNGEPFKETSFYCYFYMWRIPLADDVAAKASRVVFA